MPVKPILAAALGHTIEWFDYFGYAAFAVFFSKVLFPAQDQTAQLLNAAAVLAIGIFARPVAAWIIGWYADHSGRRGALLLSISLMCSGSLIIAVMPTYRQIGIWAPVILVAARLLQGFSMGGEYGGSTAYLSEVALRRHRGLVTSVNQVCSMTGQLLALGLLLLLQQFLTRTELEAWGWRIPFVAGAVASIGLLYLRRNLAETEAFVSAHRPGRRQEGSLAVLLRHPRQFLLAMGLTMGGTVAYYTYTTYLPKFIVNTAKIPVETATVISCLVLVVAIPLQPLVAMLSDRIGRRPVLLSCYVLMALCTVPILSHIASVRDAMTVFLLNVAGFVVISGYTATNAVVKAELFPTEVRALGVGFSFSVTTAIFGGTTEYVALWCKSAGVESAFYWYATACITVSLLVYGGLSRMIRTSVMEAEPEGAHQVP